MDGTLIAIWSAIGVSALSSVGGWIVAYNNKSNKESREFGELKGEMKGLHGRIGNCEKNVSDLDKRINTRIDWLIAVLRNNKDIKGGDK